MLKGTFVVWRATSVVLLTTMSYLGWSINVDEVEFYVTARSGWLIPLACLGDRVI